MKKSLHYENSYRCEFSSILNTQDLKQNLTMKPTRTSLVKKITIFVDRNYDC